MLAAPIASMSTRSKPSATPAQSGSPASSAASRCASSANGGQAARCAHLLVGRETLALLGAARELVIAVGEFDAAMIELEAQRDARIGGIEPRERGLRGGVAMQEGEGVGAERGAHLRADDEIEQFVAARRSRA